MSVLTICGSTRKSSSTSRLHYALANLLPLVAWAAAPNLNTLPLFCPDLLAAGRPSSCEVLAKAVNNADVVLIATPEYAHNMPAALKNALEWMVASGELSLKPVVAITCTPQEPRGEKCMKSLLWTLKAMDASVLTHFHIYGLGNKLSSADKIEDAELEELLMALGELIRENGAY